MHTDLPERASDIALTKKGESYVAAALAEADGVSFLTIDRKDPKSIGNAIDTLIDILDAMDPDPDLEAHGDEEASLGWPERGPSQLGNPAWFDQRGPMNDDRELDTADSEPWLGAPEHIYPRSQARWCAGGYDDREQDCEDEGAQCDDEGVVDGVTYA